jgi:hypothetical protein
MRRRYGFLSEPSQQQLSFASPATKAPAGFQANFAGVPAAPAKDAAASSAVSQDGNGVSIYDFTNITQSQMQGIARDLTKSGKIDMRQSLQLMLIGGIPLGQVGPNGAYRLPTAEQADAYYHQPINYFDKLKAMMAFLEKNGKDSDPVYGYEELKVSLRRCKARCPR